MGEIIGILGLIVAIVAVFFTIKQLGGRDKGGAGGADSEGTHKNWSR